MGWLKIEVEETSFRPQLFAASFLFTNTGASRINRQIELSGFCRCDQKTNEGAGATGETVLRPTP